MLSSALPGMQLLRQPLTASSSAAMQAAFAWAPAFVPGTGGMDSAALKAVAFVNQSVAIAVGTALTSGSRTTSTILVSSAAGGCTAALPQPLESSCAENRPLQND